MGDHASITVGVFNTDTRAWIGTEVDVNGGPVDVHAIDTLSRYTFGGGFIRSEQIGVGVAIGFNNIQRHTYAPSSDGRIPSTTRRRRRAGRSNRPAG